MALANSSILPTAISFSGCGFLGVYHVGVIRCIQKYGHDLFKQITKFGGVSAGSLAAAVMATCPERVPECKRMVYDLASHVRNQTFGAFSYGFRLSDHVEQLANMMLPKNAHELANGRVFLSITTSITKENKIISHFDSREELIQCLVSSCHIPWYSGRELIEYKGQHVYDGGFTNNLLSFDDEATIQVTPFSGGTTYICPKDPYGRWNISRVNQEFSVNFANLFRAKDALFPPTKQKLDQYYQEGFIDALHYLAELAKRHPEHFRLGPEEVSVTLRKRLDALPQRKEGVSQGSDNSNDDNVKNMEKGKRENQGNIEKTTKDNNTQDVKRKVIKGENNNNNTEHIREESNSVVR